MWKQRIPSIAALPMLLFTAPSDFAQEPTGPIESVVASAHPPELAGLTLQQTGPCWIYSPDAKSRELIEEGVREALGLQRRYIGLPVPTGAIVDRASVTTEEYARLVQAGASWVLPWPVTEILQPKSTDAGPADDQLRASIRENIVKQLEDQGAREMVSERRIESLVEAQLDRTRASSHTAAEGTSEARDAIAAMRHELGHFWFMQTVWTEGQHASKPGRHYGGDAPDWMDEAAAILQESTEDPMRRREAFAQLLRGEQNGLIALADFLVMRHPGIGDDELEERIQEKVNEARQQAGNVATMSIQIEASDLGDRGPLAAFYAQTAAFLEYLFERTGQARVLTFISTALIEGGSIDTWLDTRGRALGLPGTIPELEEDWTTWASERYGVVPNPPSANGVAPQQGSGPDRG